MIPDLYPEDGDGRRHGVPVRLFLSAWLLFVMYVAAIAQAPRDTDWAINGGVDNIRYSPLAQITRDNVRNLRVAWTYDSHDAFKGSEMQSNPIVVDGVLYATTPTLKVVAVDAACLKLPAFDKARPENQPDAE